MDLFYAFKYTFLSSEARGWPLIQGAGGDMYTIVSAVIASSSHGGL